MKTVCLLGSPRRGGNSDTLAGHFCDEAKSRGADIESVVLSDLNYNGCINLFQCKNTLDRCGQEDDLTPVLESIEQASILVLASPIYFTNLTGQMKLAMDRFFSFFVPGYPTAKVKTRLTQNQHLVLVQTQGEPEDRYRHILDQYSASFTGLGFQHLHLIRAWGVREPSDIEQCDEALKQCQVVAKKIYG